MWRGGLHLRPKWILGVLLGSDRPQSGVSPVPTPLPQPRHRAQGKQRDQGLRGLRLLSLRRELQISPAVRDRAGSWLLAVQGDQVEHSSVGLYSPPPNVVLNHSINLRGRKMAANSRPARATQGDQDQTLAEVREGEIKVKMRECLCDRVGSMLLTQTALVTPFLNRLQNLDVPKSLL